MVHFAVECGTLSLEFPPCNLSLNIKEICAYSSYIYSCGHNVFTRKILKTSYDIFSKSINHYLDKNKNEENDPLPFIAYTHEDFTPYDREISNEFLTHGLDDLKFYVGKLYMGNKSLANTIKQLKDDFVGKL